jgi:GT2 family glycosyltransferase
VTVSVLAYRSRATIERCVRSVLDDRAIETVELVVREQGGDDGEAAVLDRLAAGDGRVRVERGRNLGFAAGHNRAIAASTADLVVLLNADAWLEPGFLAAASAPFVDPGVGAVQPLVLRPDGSVDCTGLAVTAERRFARRGEGDPDAAAWRAAGPVFGVDGAVAVYRRVALEDVAVPSPGGGREVLDESLFAYYEDVDLSWRLRLRGWAVQYEPAAVARHERGARGTPSSSVPARVRARRATPAVADRLGFTNRRVVQLKNDRWRDLRPVVRPWLAHETASWAAELAARGPAPALWRLAHLVPGALRRRAYAQARRDPTVDVAGRWFGPGPPERHQPDI